MNFLKTHPFAVEAYFDKSIVLTFAVPREQLEGFVPDCLELDTFQNKWAFIAVAMVQTKELRLRGFPKFVGNSFFLIGYRIFVKYYDSIQKRLRGLYIIKTETDKKRMEFLGNIFTHYGFSTTDIRQVKENNIHTIISSKSKFKISIDESDTNTEIPLGSPFTYWEDARKFSGPLPHTFTYDKRSRTILIVRGIRKNWKPEPITVVGYELNFLKDLNLTNMVLASAFQIKNVPYYWEKGKQKRWN